MKTYTKIRRLGVEELDQLFDDEVVVQEKVDGANVRIYKKDGVIRAGTRNMELVLDGGDSRNWGGFMKFVEETDWSQLPEGLLMYGEWMKKHTINYGIKEPYFIGYDLYDVEKEHFLGYEKTKQMLESLGLKMINTLFKGKTDIKSVQKFIGKSVYGDVTMEGVVVKNYNKLNGYGRPLFGKVVREEFKEDNRKAFKKDPKRPENVGLKYLTKARLIKGIDRLKEQDVYTGNMSDLRYLIKYVNEDIFSEELEEIKKEVFKMFSGKISKMIAKNIVLMYKEMLNGS